MNKTVQRQPLTAALKRMLQEATARPVDVGRAPKRPNGEQESYPFIVLFPRSRGRLRGAMFTDSWSQADFEYGVRCVGLTAEQVELTADRVRSAILDRDHLGEWVFDLDIGPDQKVMDRRPDIYSPGDNRPEGTIFEVDDSFVFSITTS